jgi:hypothetical protein
MSVVVPPFKVTVLVAGGNAVSRAVREQLDWEVVYLKRGTEVKGGREMEREGPSRYQGTTSV